MFWFALSCVCELWDVWTGWGDGGDTAGRGTGRGGSPVCVECMVRGLAGVFISPVFSSAEPGGEEQSVVLGASDSSAVLVEAGLCLYTLPH